MRAFAVLAVLTGLSLPAHAQDMKVVESLAGKLKASSMIAADSPSGGPKSGPVAMIDPGPVKAVRAGWNSFKMSVCIAAIVGSDQYVAAFATTGEGLVTQSAYAIPIIAANCASGKTFWAYLEADVATISAIASYPP